MEKKILAIIPARGGSKGIPRKNIKNICGRPLISYTIMAAKNCKYIDRVIVSTEDEEIAEVSKAFGAEIPFLRPKELAEDTSPTIECIIDAINKLKENEGYYPEYVALLQCTSPLRTSRHIDEAIEQLLNSKRDGIISVNEVESNPYWTNIIKDGKLEYFIEEGKRITRRQDLPKIYEMNGAIYIIKTDILIKEKTFESENVGAYVMNTKDSVDIDDLLDFKFAELILSEGEK
ncbi:MAG: acylneuraminate cytidylyltransferase family protein [Clostridiales bacterium]|nr:acylneuraminate cytidylyltransferase family protein [Clostridiales bacterium]